MTIVRAINTQGDWTFGQSLNNYLSANMAIQQSIKTRLLSFLGDCFFDVLAGINWFNLLGSKNQTALNLSVSAIILNTQNVTGILQLSISLTQNRNFTINYNAQTVYSTVGDYFQYNLLNTASS